MKKTVLIFAMVTLLVFSAFGASAANYYPVKDAEENYSYTVKCDLGAIADDATAIVKGESMYGLVAVIGTGANAEIASATSYVYIDQATADKNGFVTFTGFLPMGAGPDDLENFEECTLFIGGPGFNTAKELGVLKDASGVPVTGKVVDTFAPAKPATVTVVVSEDNKISTETAADGTFAVTVPAGENYSVVLDKVAYLTLTYTGVNVAAATDLGDVDMSLLAGDVNEDGIVESADLRLLLEDFFMETEDLAEARTDLDGNGIAESADLTQMLKAFYEEDVVKAYAAQ